MDQIDQIIAQWKNERPDLDTAPMALIGRLQRIAQHLSHGMAKTFEQNGLNGASFDVLATLRRAGKPYAMPPTDLMQSMMITSGTMTNRIDQLEKRQLVERLPNPQDGRGFLIKLTTKGYKLIDSAVSQHVDTQTMLVDGLDSEQRKQLNKLLTKFLASFEIKN